MSAFPTTHRPPPRMAIDCLWLKRTIDSQRREDPFVMLCSHIVRDGRECIGPFLEDVETDCGLWEPNARLRERLRANG